MSESNVTSEANVIITVHADGPLEVSGTCTIKGADGSILKESESSFLCRCGYSARKPFCDGSHKRESFSDAGLGNPAA